MLQSASLVQRAVKPSERGASEIRFGTTRMDAHMYAHKDGSSIWSNGQDPMILTFQSLFGDTEKP